MSGSRPPQSGRAALHRAGWRGPEAPVRGASELNRVLRLRRALASHGYDLELRLAAVMDDLIDSALVG